MPGQDTGESVIYFSTQLKSFTLVQCPICDRFIAELDINLHLDLQCPGSSSIPGPFTPANTFRSEHDSSQPNLRSSPGFERHSQASNTTTQPAALTRKGSLTNVSVAPIFGATTGSNKRKANTAIIEDLPRSTLSTTDNAPEKKARPNPLTANQP
jgi:putative ATPase